MSERNELESATFRDSLKVSNFHGSFSDCCVELPLCLFSFSQMCGFC
jgi:hypothetical protein